MKLAGDLQDIMLSLTENLPWDEMPTCGTIAECNTAHYKQHREELKQ